MKTFQPPPRARAAAASSRATVAEELEPSNAALQDQLKSSSGGDWQDQLLAIVQARGPAPARAPEPARDASQDASVAAVWRMMLPSLAGRSDAELASMRAPVIDGPSAEEQAQWDAEWAARPEFQNHSSEAPAPAPFKDGLSWLFGKTTS